MTGLERGEGEVGGSAGVGGSPALGQSLDELQAAYADLRRSETFLDSVIENIPNMVFVKDADDLRFVRFNRAGEALLGLSRADLIGRSDHDLFPADEADFFTQKDREVLAGGQVLDIPEEPIDTPSGRRILHTKKIPVLDESGRAAYLLGISEDITERQRAEEEARAARSEAERANRAKTEFLSRMSHELRTPLNAILGFSQLLDMEELTDEQRENVGYIARAGRHLLQLINEVLDISRVESGQVRISREPVAVADVIDEVTTLARPLADGRRITMETGGAGLATHVLADRQRLSQVLLNIVSNAVKYNRAGGRIRIHVRQGEPGKLRIEVSDTGFGIAPEHLPRLFQPFDRLGAERGAVEGTGMGLALSKSLVEAMDGTIGVESRLDLGSMFWIELAQVEGPLEHLERTGGGRSTARSGRKLRILQIDDNSANVRLVSRIVARWPGIEVMAAGQGQLGIDLAREHRPDAVFLDLHLPDLPGDEVLRLLRAYPETRNTPIVILSADMNPARASRLHEAGAFGFLTKPLDVRAFLEMLDRLGARRPAHP